MRWHSASTVLATLGCLALQTSGQFVSVCGPETVPTPDDITVRYRIGTLAGVGAVQFEVSNWGTDWAAVGFQSAADLSNGMSRLDVVAFDAITDDKVLDAAATGFATPRADTTNDATLSDWRSNDAGTSVTFNRLLQTGDATDFTLSEGLSFSLAWAVGRGFVFDASWSQHTAKGKVLHTLLTCPKATPAPDTAAPTDAPTPAPTPAPVNTPAPVSTPAPVATPAPAATAAPTATPGATPAPDTAAPRPGDTPAPDTKAPGATDVPATGTPGVRVTPAPGAGTPAPDTAAPRATPAPDATLTPGTTPAPGTTPMPDTPRPDGTTPAPATDAPTPAPDTTLVPGTTAVPATAAPAASTPAPDTTLVPGTTAAPGTTATTSPGGTTPAPGTTDAPGLATPAPDATLTPGTTASPAIRPTPAPETDTPGATAAPTPAPADTAAPRPTATPATGAPAVASPAPATAAPVVTAAPTPAPVATPAPPVATGTPGGSAAPPTPAPGAVDTPAPGSPATLVPGTTAVPSTPVPGTAVPATPVPDIRTAAPATAIPATPQPQQATSAPREGPMGCRFLAQCLSYIPSVTLLPRECTCARCQGGYQAGIKDAGGEYACHKLAASDVDAVTSDDDDELPVWIWIVIGIVIGAAFVLCCAYAVLGPGRNTGDAGAKEKLIPDTSSYDRRSRASVGSAPNSSYAGTPAKEPLIPAATPAPLPQSMLVPHNILPVHTGHPPSHTSVPPPTRPPPSADPFAFSAPPPAHSQPLSYHPPTNDFIAAEIINAISDQPKDLSSPEHPFYSMRGNASFTQLTNISPSPAGPSLGPPPLEPIDAAYTPVTAPSPPARNSWVAEPPQHVTYI